MTSGHRLAHKTEEDPAPEMDDNRLADLGIEGF